MSAAMRRIASWFQVGWRSEEEQAADVQRVLGSCTLRGVLGLTSEQAGGRSTEALASDDDVEAPLEISEDDVLEAFLATAVEVHPFGNAQPSARLGLRWAVEAFCHLGGGRVPPPIPVSAREPRPILGPIRDLECAIDDDEALRIFSRTVSLVLDTLSLHDVGRGGVSRRTTDALLRGLYILHIRPAQQRWDGGARHMFDPLLSGALMANWMMARAARLFLSAARREEAERRCSTAVAAVGFVAFGGASRLRRMMLSDGGTRALGGSALGEAAPEHLEPQVQCPLCRKQALVDRVIRGVHAGEAPPTCCVCVERKSDVCLPCGHLCLCGSCFRELPRTTAEPEGES